MWISMLSCCRNVAHCGVIVLLSIEELTTAVPRKTKKHEVRLWTFLNRRNGVVIAPCEPFLNLVPMSLSAASVCFVSDSRDIAVEPVLKRPN